MYISESNHDNDYGHCIMSIIEPILTVVVCASSVIISPNDQFTVTCTARAEVDGQGLPVEVLRWVRITTSPSGSLNYSRLNSSEYDITRTGSPESSYQSILTTTENDTVNMIIYRCRARISDTKNFSDIVVTIEGSHCIHFFIISIHKTTTLYGTLCNTFFTDTSTPSNETTCTTTSTSETTTTTTPSSETTATSIHSSETTSTSTLSSITAYVFYINFRWGEHRQS